MKYIFKKLQLLAAVLTASLSLQAAVVTFDGTTTAANSLLQQQGAVTSFTFANSATNTVTFGFFNAPTNVLTYVIGAYTNSIITVGTTVQTVTNILGNITSQTNATATTSYTVQPQTTNNYPKLLTYLVPASTTVTLNLNPYLNFLSGLCVTNSATNCIVTVQYVPAR